MLAGQQPQLLRPSPAPFAGTKTQLVPAAGPGDTYSPGLTQLLAFWVFLLVTPVTGSLNTGRRVQTDVPPRAVALQLLAPRAPLTPVASTRGPRGAHIPLV